MRKSDVSLSFKTCYVFLMQCRAFLEERNDDKLQKSMTLYSGESSALAAYRKDDSAQIAH